MATTDVITLFHSPQTRSSGALALLEELGAPYELHLLNMKIGEQRRSTYLAINPLGKVPAIRYRGALVTEQVAIFLYLADLFPKSGLAPTLDSPLRGPYLRWMVYYAACYEPALVDRAMKREPAPPTMCPYSDFDSMLNTVVDRLASSPYLLGDNFSSADLLWGIALQWGTLFKLVPENPVIVDYIARVTARPSVKAVAEMDAEWAAQHERVAQEMNA